MPSPFPGMDPYLESSLWTTVHFSLSAEIVRQLAPKLRLRYLVLPAERFIMESAESVAVTATDMYPDAGVAASDSPRILKETASGRTGSYEGNASSRAVFCLFKSCRKTAGRRRLAHCSERLAANRARPLLPDDDDAILDMQAAFSAM